MEEYMTTTREDYSSGIARLKIDDKDNFELKGQILKELRTKTFSAAKDEDPNEHIEKVFEIADLFHIPHVTQDQVMLRAFPMSLTGAASRWLRNEPFGRFRYTAPGFYQRDSGNNSYQEQRKTLEESLKSFMAESSKRHDDNNNLIKEIRSLTDAALRNQGASIKALEIKIGASVRVMPYATYTKLDFIVLDILEDIKTPLIHGRPFLSTAHAKNDVHKGKIALRVREDKNVLTTNKPTSNIIRRVYAISSLDRMEASEQILKELDARNDLDDNRNDNVEYDVCEEISNGVDKVDYNGSNEITIIHDLPIFVGAIHVITNFTIVKSLDEYCDAGIGDLIVGRPFCSQVIIERFDGTITISDGYDFVTYQLPRACPKLKNLSNAQ
ncbi:hypothetical protein Tco_0862589 [Tanacetum coccineum]